MIAHEAVAAARVVWGRSIRGSGWRRLGAGELEKNGLETGDVEGAARSRLVCQLDLRTATRGGVRDEREARAEDRQAETRGGILREIEAHLGHLADGEPRRVDVGGQPCGGAAAAAAAAQPAEATRRARRREGCLRHVLLLREQRLRELGIGRGNGVVVFAADDEVDAVRLDRAEQPRGLGRAGRAAGRHRHF